MILSQSCCYAAYIIAFCGFIVVDLRISSRMLVDLSAHMQNCLNCCSNSSVTSDPLPLIMLILCFQLQHFSNSFVYGTCYKALYNRLFSNRIIVSVHNSKIYNKYKVLLLQDLKTPLQNW